MNEIRDLLRAPSQGRHKTAIYEAFAYFLTQEIVFGRTSPIRSGELSKHTRLGSSTAHQTLEVMAEREYADRHDMGITRVRGAERTVHGYTLTDSGREMGIVVVSFTLASPQYEKILLHEGLQFPPIPQEPQAE